MRVCPGIMTGLHVQSADFAVHGSELYIKTGIFPSSASARTSDLPTTSSRVSSVLLPLCTVYNPSFDLRACDPISTCVSNRTHAPIRSCSPVEGYRHRCFFNSTFPCPSRKRSTTRLSSIFWSADGYACCARFLIFSANSSAVAVSCVRAALRGALLLFLEGRICVTSVLAKSYNRLIDQRSCLSANSRLGPSMKRPDVPLVLLMSSPDGAQWPRTG